MLLQRVRLADLQATPWRHTLNKVSRTMRPLHLQTFAELEGLGVTMGGLQAGKVEQWLDMYAYLADLPMGDGENPHEDMALMVMNDPIGFKEFQEIVRAAFQGSEPGEGPTVVRRRKIQHPVEAEREKEREREGKPKETDMGFLVLLARMSGISLSELFRMTFRGIHAVQASLEEMPPSNPLAALFGGGGGKSVDRPGRRR